MAVNIIWSLTQGGAAISSLVDHGDSSNGEATSAETIFVRHDGSNIISNASLFMREYSGSYSGSATSSLDKTELTAWGNGTDTDAFGGFMVSFDGATWPTFALKSQTITGEIAAFAHRTGIGDSEINAQILPTLISGILVAGEVPIGSPDVSFKCRVDVPTDEDTVGIRQWDQVLSFVYTS